MPRFKVVLSFVVTVPDGMTRDQLQDHIGERNWARMFKVSAVEPSAIAVVPEQWPDYQETEKS